MAPTPRPLTVVVTGSECTGKTTLAAALAAEFDAPWSHEFAREYVDIKQAPLDESDVEPIARGQLAAERAVEQAAAEHSGRIVIRDTDLVSTTVYSRHYYGTCPGWIARAARERIADLYLLLCPDVPWVPDGLQRDRPDEASRAEVHALFRDALAAAGARVVEVRGDWRERHAEAAAAVKSAVEAGPARFISATRDSIQVGLVGFGMAGRVFHAPVLNAVPGLHLAAIVQRTGETAALAYPDVRVVRSVDELLAMSAIRLVVIATPTASHAELARRCLEAGRDVVIDKPFAATAAEAASLLRVADRAGRLLSAFHNRRWDGDFLTVQRLTAEGVCGRIVSFESHFDRYRPRLKGTWRERAGPGSGILFDLGSHLVDQAVVLFGPPEAVTADVRLERDGAAVDDAFDVVFHYQGRHALLRSTMYACEPGPRFVLRGTEGTYVKHGLDPQEERLARGDTPDGPDWGVEPPERWGALTRPDGDGTVREKVATEAGDYRRYYANIRDAILARAPLAVTPRQALDVIRLLELARESSRQNRTMSFERENRSDLP